jgi:hypothetical protein
MRQHARWPGLRASGLFVLFAGLGTGQVPIRATVDFRQHIREWDGFGVNYVETAQTRDYRSDQQEYGGFSLLPEEQRQQILEMIFGPEGLKPGLLKMFLDPHHQGTGPAGKYDHQTTTRWIRYFAKQGLAKTRQRGGDLTIITTATARRVGWPSSGRTAARRASRGATTTCTGPPSRSWVSSSSCAACSTKKDCGKWV